MRIYIINTIYDKNIKLIKSIGISLDKWLYSKIRRRENKK